MVSPEHLDLRTIAPQPWKNGAGLTREIAVGRALGDSADLTERADLTGRTEHADHFDHSDRADRTDRTDRIARTGCIDRTRPTDRNGAVDLAARGAHFDWRFSIAEVAHDAPFSTFAHTDRCIVLLGGAGMRLRSREPGRLDHALTTPFLPFCFAGDLTIDATLLDGPCSDFNVMTRRGQLHSEVEVLRQTGEVADADVTLLWCCTGVWQVAGDPLQAMQGRLWREPRGTTLRARLFESHDGHDESAVLLAIRLCHDRPS